MGIKVQVARQFGKDWPSTQRHCPFFRTDVRLKGDAFSPTRPRMAPERSRRAGSSARVGYNRRRDAAAAVLTVARRQKAWIASRLARPAPDSARGMNDGFRLPGREGIGHARRGAGPVVNRDDGLTMLLTQRSADLPDHPGQISFPGGRVEPEDATLADAALREAAEEVGLPRERVAILGELPTTRRSRLSRDAGRRLGRAAVRADARPVEVADVFEVPLAFLLDPATSSGISACRASCAATSGRFRTAIATSGARRRRC